MAKISGFIFRHGGNILDADQHTDLETGVFLARMEWDLEGFEILRAQIAARFQPLAQEHQIQFEVHFSDDAPKLAIFASRMLHCLQDLLLRHRAGEFQAEIAMVVSNHLEANAVAQEFGIPFLHFPITAASKKEQEAREIGELRARGIDLIVLARYMQILSEDFVAAFPNRIINIHHSFLPAFARGQAYHQAFQRGVKLIGATSHYVTMDLDEGPIIEQKVARVSHRDSVPGSDSQGEGSGTSGSGPRSAPASGSSSVDLREQGPLFSTEVNTR